MNNCAIKDLLDYPILKKFSSALWQQNNAYHGAAVIVGAGFSRVAAYTADKNKKLPLWYDLAKVIADELKTDSIGDPLRMAEEYSAYFGKQAINELVIKVINDKIWLPGEIYKSLLTLPWSEVLTTNWDTLLERSADEIHNPTYSTVNKCADLSSSHSPRIVKLHGTISLTEQLIFSQEDYRRYPETHAAYVNFARQVFIENELCLVGFSGDDPNFLKWAGWVRDQLANNARKIYLVGALNLTSAKRKYLESINICPIDLYLSVKEFEDKDLMHFEATKLFLEELHKLKPRNAWEWPTFYQNKSNELDFDRLYKDNAYASKVLLDRIPLLKKERLGYPNWLICPFNIHGDVKEKFNRPYPTKKIFELLDDSSKHELIYEITWASNLILENLPDWVLDYILIIIESDSVLNIKQKIQISIIYLQHQEWYEINEGVICLLSDFIETNSRHYMEGYLELKYLEATRMRNNLDYSNLEKAMEYIDESTPIWKIRKACLYSELGEYSKGSELLLKAYSELLKQYRRDKLSIQVISVLTWCKWLLKNINWMNNYVYAEINILNQNEIGCDPWLYLESINSSVNKYIEKQIKHKSIEPSFEPGRYKDHSDAVTISNACHPYITLSSFIYKSGLPIRWRNSGLLVNSATSLLKSDDLDSFKLFSLAIRSASSDTSDSIKFAFSREKVSSFNSGEVNEFIKVTRGALSYWIEKYNSENNRKGDLLERIRIFIEVLARLSVRTSEVKAIELFKLGCDYCSDLSLRHFWLHESLSHLLDYSLSNIPKVMQSEVLLSALQIPLASEIDLVRANNWPNPIIFNPGCRENNNILNRRIDDLIEQIKPNSIENSYSLLRLLPLIDEGFLTLEEICKLKIKLWGEEPNYNEIPTTGLYSFSLLKLPSFEPAKVKELVRQHLFDINIENKISASHLNDISNAALSHGIKEFPSHEQARVLFLRMVSWKPDEDSNDYFNITKQNNIDMARSIAQALAVSIIPSLSQDEVNENNFNVLCSHYDLVKSPQLLKSLPYFFNISDVIDKKISKMIRDSLQSDDGNFVANSAHAVLVWSRLGKGSGFIDELILSVIYLIFSYKLSGLSSVLWVAQQFVKDGKINSLGLKTLSETLPVIFSNSEYSKVLPNSKESVDITLIRAGCIKLARELLAVCETEQKINLEKIIEISVDDPLPEVRFA